MAPSTSFHLALDLGGTRVKAGIVGPGGALESATVQPAEARAGLARALDGLAHLVEGLCAGAGLDPRAARGILVGFPGIVHPATGRILSTMDKYPDAPSVDLGAWAAERWGIPAAVENDAHAALLGESAAGAAKGFADAVMMTLGTGVGTAAIMGGALARGPNGRAGCLGGHFAINHAGRPCPCGNIGCVESEASTWAIPLMMAEWDAARASSLWRHPQPGYLEVLRDAEAGDALSRRIRDHSIRIWSMAALNLVQAYDPQVLVVGGGVARSFPALLESIESHIDRHAWPVGARVPVVPAAHPEYAALLGAPLANYQSKAAA